MKDMLEMLHLFAFKTTSKLKLCVQRLNNYFTNKQSKKQFSLNSTYETELR